ncbi:DUF1380 family protein, partial [Klebsiella sp. A-Nf5]|uniref:DUF1380 family protein n=1 Tax=Klebsiella sp. A-Nf5 TaxID=2054608 RepID=UPI0013FE0875
KENGQRVTVPVDLLETLLITAEQALWDSTTGTVPDAIARRRCACRALGDATL